MFDINLICVLLSITFSGFGFSSDLRCSIYIFIFIYYGKTKRQREVWFSDDSCISVLTQKS